MSFEDEDLWSVDDFASDEEQVEIIQPKAKKNGKKKKKKKGRKQHTSDSESDGP